MKKLQKNVTKIFLKCYIHVTKIQIHLKLLKKISKVCIILYIRERV